MSGRFSQFKALFPELENGPWNSFHDVRGAAWNIYADLAPPSLGSGRHSAHLIPLGDSTGSGGRGEEAVSWDCEHPRDCSSEPRSEAADIAGPSYGAFAL